MIGAHSTLRFDESDDDNDLLPPEIIVNERQSLLLGLDRHPAPRYMTASPCMFPFFFCCFCL